MREMTLLKVVSSTAKLQKAKISRNPKSGLPVKVASKRKIRFKASKTLLKELNKNFTGSKIPLKASGLYHFINQWACALWGRGHPWKLLNLFFEISYQKTFREG